MDSLKFVHCVLILFCIVSDIFANVGKNDRVLESGDLAYIVQEMYRKIGNLQKVVTSQGEVIAKLEHESKLLKSLISKQEDTINELKMKLGYDDIQSHVENAKTHSDNGEKSRIVVVNEEVEIKSTDNKIRGLRAAGSSQVAFSTYLSRGQNDIGAKQIIKFDGVITNDGNGYNQHSGMFTAPVTGTYVFFAILNSSENNVTFHLMVDDIPQASGTARPPVYNQAKDTQATALVILRLNQGASVWVENVGANTNIYSNYLFRWNTFSGYLLY